MTDFIYLDIETRSTVNLRARPAPGAYRYFECEHARVLCASWAINDDPVQSIGAEMECPSELAYAIKHGLRVSGWNCGGFEKIAFKTLLGPVNGWPVPRDDQWDDTMAQAAAMALPLALGMCAEVLDIDEQKDKEGTRLINRFSKPRRVLKADLARGVKPGAILWNEPEDNPEDFQKFRNYCDTDVEVERAIKRKLVPLSDTERAVWLLDQKINERGIFLDRELVDSLEEIAATTKAALDKKMKEATNGEITACSQASALTAWVNDECRKHDGIPFGDTIDGVSADEVGAALKRTDLPAHVREALELRQMAAKTSTAKLDSMKATVCRDGRIKGTKQYHGASTGRWAGRLTQCVTGDHEVLTREGWKPISETVGPVEIMQWDPETGRMSWANGVVNVFAPPEKIAVVDGTMIKGAYTLDHRMPNVRNGVVDYTPKQLTDLARTDSFLLTAPVDQPDTTITDTQIRLLVALQADGTVRDSGTIHWKFHKERKAVRLQQLLAEAGVLFRHPPTPYCPFSKLFIVDSGNVPGWLSKGFGPWVLGLSARQANILFEELAHWDGHRHKKSNAVTLSSPDKEQVEWMVTAGALAGISCSLSWYPNPKSKRGAWRLYARASSRTSIYGHQVSILPNDKPVYCPTVPGRYWLCRYQNRVYITGNTDNMPRGTGTIKDPDRARQWLVKRDPELIQLLYGNPLYAVSDCLRACFTASPGNHLMVADYSSIEGRVTAWLAGEAWKLEMFRKNDRKEGPGAYETTAASIFNVPVETITKDSPLRQQGKAGELAFGFAGGVMSFVNFAGDKVAAAYEPVRESADPEIFEKAVESHERWSESGLFGTDMLSREAWIAAEVIKVSWRLKHPATVRLWDELENCIFAAIRDPGTIASYGNVSYLVRRGFLWCRLPSGRCLAYGSPRIGDTKTPWGSDSKFISVVGMKTIKGNQQKWMRYALNKSIIIENVVQATARDLLVHGLLNLDAAGYPLILHVHDEAVADVPKGFGSLAEFEALLCDLPDWADGLPLVAEGYIAHSYRK